MDEPYGPDHPAYLAERALRIDPFFDQPVRWINPPPTEAAMYGVRDTVEYQRLTEQVGTLEAKLARLQRVEAAAARLVKAIESGKWKSAQKRLESALEAAHR
ncbi:hypothetical protein CEW87_03950 [Parazoarcus communis]|uniref:Uncharacterized protein n=1 Tax=Parazoarcus communis TaxID=41977 RepID=A0A2U8H077_9RHOO|nr:hypothetical protein [Parazoarcus communis]AWI78586.1 hypothetical protein CEW87_03950 [Parazoarcus communis]